MNKMNKKGFTLAELLIVVAIIGVLSAIAIPVFTSQLEKSREATDIANIRGYYGEITSALLSRDLEAKEAKITVGSGLTAARENVDLPTTKDSTFTVTVSGATLQQKVVDWQTKGYDIAGVTSITGIDSSIPAATKVKIEYTFKLAADADYYLSAIEISAAA